MQRLTAAMPPSMRIPVSPSRIDEADAGGGAGVPPRLPAERPEEHIGVDLGFAEHLGETSGPDVTPEVHLPKPVLGVGVALGEEEVVRARGIDVGHSELVSQHLHR